MKGNNAPAMELPRYKSHKEVWALKIKQVRPDHFGADGGATLFFEADFYAPLDVDGRYMDKHRPQEGGYFVQYKDGYQSFWPAEAFEDGFTPLGATGKTLHNSTVSGARKNVKDIKVVGNGDMFRLLCKASSEAEGWMKSTKAMQTDGGCLVQVTTQQRNPDGSYAVAEALSFVPYAVIRPDENGGSQLGTPSLPSPSLMPKDSQE